MWCASQCGIFQWDPWELYPDLMINAHSFSSKGQAMHSFSTLLSRDIMSAWLGTHWVRRWICARLLGSSPFSDFPWSCSRLTYYACHESHWYNWAEEVMSLRITVILRCVTVLYFGGPKAELFLVPCSQNRSVQGAFSLSRRETLVKCKIALNDVTLFDRLQSVG